LEQERKYRCIEHGELYSNRTFIIIIIYIDSGGFFCERGLNILIGEKRELITFI